MGAEMRAISALDVALWDLLGQIAGQPIYNMLGGRSRDRIRVYNTCVGFGKYPDLDAWLERPRRRAGRRPARPGHHRDEDLAVRPVRPDPRRTRAASASRSSSGARSPPPARSAIGISNDELKPAASPSSRTSARRSATGCRSPSRATRAGTCRAAAKIARALEPYDVMWLEEIMPPDNVDAYVRLKAETASRSARASASSPASASARGSRRPPPTSSCRTSPGAAA